VSPVRPDQVEARLVELSQEYDAAHADLVAAERAFYDLKADYELAIARARLSQDAGTVQQREDRALIACEVERRALATAEALVRAARANASRLQTQADITRSVGAVLRVGMGVA